MSGSTNSIPLSGEERLARANQLYREYHTRCFWHSPRSLIITEELLPFVVKGLRTHGGRRGFILAGQLQPQEGDLQATGGESQEGL